MHESSPNLVTARERPERSPVLTNATLRLSHTPRSAGMTPPAGHHPGPRTARGMGCPGRGSPSPSPSPVRVPAITPRDPPAGFPPRRYPLIGECIPPAGGPPAAKAVGPRLDDLCRGDEAVEAAGFESRRRHSPSRKRDRAAVPADGKMRDATRHRSRTPAQPHRDPDPDPGHPSPHPEASSRHPNPAGRLPLPPYHGSRVRAQAPTPSRLHDSQYTRVLGPDSPTRRMIA